MTKAVKLSAEQVKALDKAKDVLLSVLSENSELLFELNSKLSFGEKEITMHDFVRTMTHLSIITCESE